MRPARRLVQLSVAIVLFVIIEIVNADDPLLNDGELDWDGLTDHLCSVDNGKAGAINKCAELDPNYKIQSILNECDQKRAPAGSNWFDSEKAECTVQQCYQEKYKTDDYKKAFNEFTTMSNADFDAKQREKFECIKKAMGI